MTKEEKLKKIIEYAVERGWKGLGMGKEPDTVFYWLFEAIDGKMSYREILFSHDFAKVFWGEEGVDKNGKTEKEYNKYQTIDGSGWSEYQKSWQHHLQMCVISDDPIDYYFKFLKKND